jgi:hypothetical protein
MWERLAPGQRWIRALYSGGTLATEAQVIWQRAGLQAFSNVPLHKTHALPDVGQSREHTVIDLGAPEFTVGRPHPMIDFRARVERLLAEARDPSTAVILLDVVLGWGAHPDPSEPLVPAVQHARALAQKERRFLAVVGSVCGTEGDPQDLKRQESRLAQAGMLLAPSNAAAARLAAAIATRGGARMEGLR